MLKSFVNHKKFTEGQVIFLEDQPGEVAYLVNRGKIEIRKRTPDGEDQAIAVVGEHELFGEMALIDGSPRMATAVALEATDCTVIERRQLTEKLDKTDHNIRFVISFLMDYIRSTCPYELREDVSDRNMLSEKDKTASMIVDSGNIAQSMESQDLFLRALFEVLVSYARRRLPPDVRSQAQN